MIIRYSTLEQVVKPCLSDAVLQVETLEQFFLQISLWCLHLSIRSILQIHPKRKKKNVFWIIGIRKKIYVYWIIERAIWQKHQHVRNFLRNFLHKKLFKKVFARSWRTWYKKNPRDLWLYISFKSFLCLIISPCHGLKIEKSQLIWNQIPYNWSQNWKFIKEWLRTIFLLKNFAGLWPILTMDQFKGSSRDHIIYVHIMTL